MNPALIADKLIAQSAAFVQASREVSERALLVTALREITGSTDMIAKITAEQALIAVGETA